MEELKKMGSLNNLPIDEPSGVYFDNICNECKKEAPEKGCDGDYCINLD